MKHFTLIILLCSIASGLIAGTIEKTYHFEKPIITTQGEYQLIEFENLLITGKTGEPALPYKDLKLLLPPGEVATSISFEGINEVQIPGFYQIYPRQASRPLSETTAGKFMKNESVYTSDDFYPIAPTGILTTSYMNGYSIAMSTFTPVQYNPLTGMVSYFQEVKITIKTVPDGKSAVALENLNSSTRTTKRITNFVQNPALLMNYPSGSKDADDYQLLIVTPELFEEDFEDYTSMYFDRGIKSSLTTIEYIEDNGTGQDLAEKLRNFIIDEYQDHNVEFVLLGGDVEHIPYRGFYCYVESGSGYTDSGIPADLYYSALDGTWNDDDDNKWGEIGEEDLLPDIAVARFSFSNLTELENMINKTVSYQNDPVLGEFNDALLAGEWLYGNPETYGSDYLELLIDYQDENGYETYGIPEDYTFHKLYESEDSWSANDLIDEINEGRQFVHHVGHANSNYVAFMSNSTITDANFSGANGVDHNFTLFQSHGCICGAFDDSDCIMEKMHSIENFAVAVIGNSRYGWFNEGQTEGPAQHLHREMVDALYHEKMGLLGQAFLEAKIQTAPWVTAPGQWEEGALRWNFYDINILGDPAMSIWSQEPIEIDVDHAGVYTMGAGTYEVAVTSDSEAMQDFRCALILEGELIGVGITDDNGETVFDISEVSAPGDAQLVVSGYNCLPQLFDVTVILAGPTYVHYLDHQLDDSQSNGNGQIDCGETSLKIDITLENLGEEQADNIDILLNTSSPYVIISDDSEDVGSIGAGASSTLSGAFIFDVAEDIPDQTVIDFEMTITWGSGEEEVVNFFEEIANAPLITMGSILIDDLENGNGNGIMDPGETVSITVLTSNDGHCSSEEVQATLSSANPDISILNANYNLGILVDGESANAIFSVEVDENASIGNSVVFEYNAVAGSYSLQEEFSLTIGLVVEDFETGNFFAYGWQFDGDADWLTDDQNPHEGTYCAQSGAIGDLAESVLQISMEVLSESDISFFRKVSSEGSYDYLRFYIDNVLMDEWSGEEDWDEFSYPITIGEHTFTWTYEKDYSMNNGSDCAWLDYIIFPAATGYANVLGVAVSADPEEICFGFSSQLTAMGMGGNGVYDYAWQPSTGLSDPDVSDPIASPEETTIYTVTVDDGESTVSEEFTLVVNDIPITPSISQEDDHLISSASSGNQWYDTDGPISGAVDQVFYPEATDNYYVIVENEFECSSDPSNTLYFIYTGIQDNLDRSFSIFPNPSSGRIEMRAGSTLTNAKIRIMNMMNQPVYTTTVDLKKGESKALNLEHLTKGVYFVTITCESGNRTEKISIQ